MQALAPSDTSWADRLVTNMPRDLALASIVATGIILARLFVISGYDPVTAIQIAGSAGFFSLIVALILSVFPIVLSSVVAVTMMIAVERRRGHQDVGPELSAAIWFGVFVILFLVPVTTSNYAPVIAGIVTLAVSAVLRKVAHYLMMLVMILTLALLIKGVVLDSDPLGQAQSFTIVRKGAGGESVQNTVVGVTLSSSDPQTTILSYSPRAVFVIPAAELQHISTCSLSRGKKTLPLAEAILIAMGRDRALSTSVQPCY